MHLTIHLLQIKFKSTLCNKAENNAIMLPYPLHCWDYNVTDICNTVTLKTCVSQTNIPTAFRAARYIHLFTMNMDLLVNLCRIIQELLYPSTLYMVRPWPSQGHLHNIRQELTHITFVQFVLAFFWFSYLRKSSELSQLRRYVTG